MLAYVVKRVLATIPTIGIVAVFVFLMLRLTPGDPAAVIAGDYATAEDIARIREKLGLTEPILVQFTTWAGQLLQGDLGTSIFNNLPVSTLIAQRVGPTLALAATTLTFSVLVAVPLGTLAAWRAGSLLDRAIMVFAVAGFSVPVFVLGYALVYLIALQGGVLPVQGYRPLSSGFWPWLQHLILPTLTLSVIYIALIARITRAAVMEVMGEDYVRTARAKGQSRVKVLLRHALANAAVPIVTVVGLGVALLIGGVVVTETVFNIPGLGRLVLDAVLARDYPIIQGLILFFALIYVLVNLVIDLSYTLFDPRIRY